MKVHIIFHMFHIFHNVLSLFTSIQYFCAGIGIRTVFENVVQKYLVARG